MPLSRDGNWGLVRMVVEEIIDSSEVQIEIADSASASFVASIAFASGPFETWRLTSEVVLVRLALAFADAFEA